MNEPLKVGFVGIGQMGLPLCTNLLRAGMTVTAFDTSEAALNTIVAGGEHITACADYVLADCPALNLCVLGEGEDTLLDIVGKTFAGEDPRTVDGVAFRQDGAVQRNPARARTKEPAVRKRNERSV